MCSKIRYYKVLGKTRLIKCPILKIPFFSFTNNRLKIFYKIIDNYFDYSGMNCSSCSVFNLKSSINMKAPT